MQREADQQDKQIQQQRQQFQQQQLQQQIGGDNMLLQQEGQEKQISTIDNHRLSFRWMELFKSAAFGGCIGAITGTAFGFMDGMRTAGQSEVLKNASNMAKGRYILQGTTRSATIFGVFFGGFHIVRYGIRIAVDPGEFTEIGLSAVISMSALMSRPAYRPSMPYASMLIIMDGVHVVMRQFND